jgi:TP901 family phage tail tape measure protein
MSLNNLGLGFLFTAKDLSGGVMKHVRDNFTEVNGAASEAAKSVAASFKSFGIGTAIMGAGLLGLAALTPAIEESRELGKAIALVATESDTAVFPVERMKEMTEQLASTYAKAPVDEATALYEAVGMGANTAAKAQALLAGANRLAVAGNADLKTSTDALGGALRAYGADQGQATEYADTMFTAMTNGKTTVQDLASSLGRITSMSANLKISFPEITAAISTMTSNNIGAAEAVSGLHEALANIIHPSSEARAEAARLGIKFTQTELSSKGLYGMLKEVTGAAKFNANTFSKLFTSVEGLNAIQQVASHGMSDFSAVLEAMDKKAGATEKGFQIMNDTLAFQTEKLEANKKVALGMIGDAIEPMSKSFTTLENSIVEAFIHSSKPMKSFLVTTFQVVSILAVVVGGALAIYSGFSLLSMGATALGITFGGVMAVLWPVVLVLGALALGWVAVKNAYDKNLGNFATQVNGVWEDVKLIFTSLVELFSGGGFTGDTSKKLAQHSGIKEFVINVYAWVMRAVEFFKKLGAGFMVVMDTLGPILGYTIGLLSDLADKFTDLTGGNEGPTAAANAFDAFGTAGKGAGEAIGAVMYVVVAAIDAVIFAVSLVVSSVSASIGVVSSLFSGIIDIFTGVTTIVMGIVHGSWSEIWLGMKTVAFGAIDGIMGILLSLVKGIAGAIDAIAGLFGKKTEWSREIKGLQDTLHNDMAKTMGVDGVVGTRAVTYAAPGEGSGVLRQTGRGGTLEHTPASVNPSGAPPGDPHMLSSNALAEIAKNTADAAKTEKHTHVTVMLDGDVIGKYLAKTKKGDLSRDMIPGRVPT